MSSKVKRNLLLISISLLVLVIVIYRYSVSAPVALDEAEGEKPTVAFILKQKTIEISHNISQKIQTARENREKKKEEKRLAELALLTEHSDQPEAYIIPSDEPQYDNTISTLIDHQFYTDLDGKRYVVSYSKDAGDNLVAMYNEIPFDVDGISFQPVEDKVYAAFAAKLYKNPQFEGGAVATAGAWEEFKRVGISKDCCYQLVTKSGEILYGDGLYFRRYREDMELTEKIDFPGERVTLEVKNILQNPTLPTGCEITSLAIILNYMGYNVAKETLSDNYLSKKPVGEANFYKEFVGNPRNSSSYGCYAGAIVAAANSYLSEQGAMEQARDYTDCSFADVMWKVRSGKPVIVWVTTPITLDPGYTTEWIVDGEYLVWKGNLHCVVVTGYDTNKGTVIVSDPLAGNREVEMELFVKRFKQFYSQAVVIE